MGLIYQITINAKLQAGPVLIYAVANEVLGNTDVALESAQKSYEYYDDKLGRSYSKVLLRRKSIEGF